MSEKKDYLQKIEENKKSISDLNWNISKLKDEISKTEFARESLIKDDPKEYITKFKNGDFKDQKEQEIKLYSEIDKLEKKINYLNEVNKVLFKTVYNICLHDFEDDLRSNEKMQAIPIHYKKFIDYANTFFTEIDGNCYCNKNYGYSFEISLYDENNHYDHDYLCDETKNRLLDTNIIRNIILSVEDCIKTVDEKLKAEQELQTKIDELGKFAKETRDKFSWIPGLRFNNLSNSDLNYFMR